MRTFSSLPTWVAPACIGALFLAASACDSLGTRAHARIDNVGADHNRALAVLEREAPVRGGGALTMDEFGGLWRATENYYVNQQGYDRELVAEAGRIIVHLVEASGLVYERGGRRYVDFGDSPESVLRITDYQVKEGQMSPRLGQALRATYEYGAKVQDVAELLKYIDAEFGGTRWTEDEQRAVDAFVSVAHASAAYWPNGEDEPAGRPKWHTILADAIGAAGGALAGSFTGPAAPIISPILAGGLSAMVSHVFGRSAPGFVGGPRVIEGRK